MPTEKTINVYTYSELSEKAKEKAIAYYFENVFDGMICDDLPLLFPLLSLSDGSRFKDGWILEYTTVCGWYEYGLQVKRVYTYYTAWHEGKREEYERGILADYLEDGESIESARRAWIRSRTFTTYKYNTETKKRELYLYVGEFLDNPKAYIVGLSIEDEIRASLLPDESKETWDIFDYLWEVCNVWNTYISETIEDAESEERIADFFDSNDYNFLSDGTIDRF